MYQSLKKELITRKYFILLYYRRKGIQSKNQEDPMIDAEIYYGTQKEMVKGIIPGIYKCEIMKVNPR